MIKNKYYIDQEVYIKENAKLWALGIHHKLYKKTIGKIIKTRLQAVDYILGDGQYPEEDIIPACDLVGWLEEEARAVQTTMMSKIKEAAQNLSCEAPIQLLGQVGYFVKIDNQQEGNQE